MAAFYKAQDTEKQLPEPEGMFKLLRREFYVQELTVTVKHAMASTAAAKVSVVDKKEHV
jgi:hypothetical protein